MCQQRESKQHLETKIRMIEDELLRTRNVYEIEKYRKELTFMRRKLQKMQYESQPRTLLFSLTFFFKKQFLS